MSGFDDQQQSRRGRVELASRNNAGIHVTLLWLNTPTRSRLSFATTAPMIGFELALEPEANVLDAFEHPYAYAACRIDYQQAELRSAI
jgi:hypothetical protein